MSLHMFTMSNMPPRSEAYIRNMEASKTPWYIKARQAMRQAGVKGYELAAMIDKAPSTVSQYLSGERMPPLSVLKEIASVLDVTVPYLTEDDPSFAATDTERLALKSIRAIPKEQQEIALKLLQSLEHKSTDKQG